MTPYREITDDQWCRVVTLFPELQPRQRSRGRPLTDTRAVLNGVLWVIYSGAAWSAMPRRYPSYQTCHRRFKGWYDSGVFRNVLGHLYGEAAEALCESIKVRMRATPVPCEAVAPIFATVEPLPLAYLPALRPAA